MEVLKDIKNVTLGRIKGAFGGTFILLWLAWNWRLIFIVFNFKNDDILNYKLKIIDYYIADATYWKLLWFPLIFTFISVTFYTLFNHITKIIIEFFEIQAPKFLHLLGSSKIIFRNVYDELLVKYEKLDDKYNNVKKKSEDKIEELEIEKDKSQKFKKEKTELEKMIREKERNLLSKDKEFQSSLSALKESSELTISELRNDLISFDEVKINPSEFFDSDFTIEFSNDDNTEVIKKEIHYKNNRISFKRIMSYSDGRLSELIDEGIYYNIEYIKRIKGVFIQISYINKPNGDLRKMNIMRVGYNYVGTDNGESIIIKERPPF